jgi:hypothetical protein
MALTTTKISNHKVFPTVERTVLIDSFQVVDSRKEIFVYYTISYQQNGTDVTAQFSKKQLPITANNAKRIIVRDDNMQPVPDPKWDGKDPLTQYLTLPGYDYLIQYITKTVPVATILSAYVQINDADGFFDK